ncbi:MAG: hypothetical protein AAF125_24575, partial [Chloroflexota bacterium]
PSLPRIITVDPSGNVARIVRATIDLSEYACRQIDVPSGAEALEEMKIGGGSIIISALDLEDMSSLTLAEDAHQINADIAVILLADETDPFMDEDEQRERGLVYLQRPIQIHEFAEVVFAGMRGTDIFEAQRKAYSGGGEEAKAFGPVPAIDTNRAGTIIDQLLIDLGAMAIILLGRDGTMLVERGADNYLDTDDLLNALIPSIQSTIAMRPLVGGDATMLQFFDGDTRDVYTLSVGLHHMLCIAYDGERGQRQFGMVNNLGRRAAMDLIALLGAEAFLLRGFQPEEPDEDELPRRTMAAPRVQLSELDEPVQLERATEFTSEAPELDRVQMEAIDDSEFDPGFLDLLGSLDESAADDLFSLENLENADLNVKLGKTLSDDEARNIGLFDS